jgi:elongation factor G
MSFDVGAIRNVALVGHAGSGKTTLGEALLLKAGVTKRLGSIDEKTSILDFDDESRERKHSLDSSLFHIEHNDLELNFIDTPGLPDFCGPAIEALSAVETAAIVVSAVNGIGVNTRRMAKAAADFGLARFVIINKVGADNANVEEVYNAVRETFGTACHAINLPADGGKKIINIYKETQGDSDLGDVAKAHQELIEAIIETDEALMQAYMAGGEVPLDQLDSAIARAAAAGSFIPVVFTNAVAGLGIQDLLDAFEEFAPSPLIGKQRTLVTGEGDNRKETPIKPDPAGEFIAQIFKVATDNKSHIKYCVARVFSGHLRGDQNIFVGDERKGHRAGHVHKLMGAEHVETDEASVGDIIAFAKLEGHLGQMLYGHSSEGVIERPRKPHPMFSLAIEPKTRGDVEKIGAALQRFADEDPCFQYHRDPDTHELLISGMGDQHVAVMLSKMKRYYKIDVNTHPPKIPYRETITGSAKYVEYTHKKQTGGAGQFAKVVIDMEPLPRGEGYVFEDKIFGGVIDQAFRPAVDKGIREQMKRGVIAGCHVVDVKVALVDGKTHPVDSKDIAFQIAGRQVFKKAFMECKPILLEPIVKIEVTVPQEFVGDITRDIAGKRGQVQGQDVLPGNIALVTATVPLAEVSTYASQLKSVTGGQGSFVMEFSHFDVVPPNVQQQVMSKYKAVETDDE